MANESAEYWEDKYADADCRRSQAESRIAELERQVADLTAEWDAMQRERDIGKGFHDIAVAQRNVAWSECRTALIQLKRAGELLTELEWEGERYNDSLEGSEEYEYTSCIACGGYNLPGTGHAKDCHLATTIAEIDKLKEGRKDERHG